MPDKPRTSTKTFRIHYILSQKPYRLDSILVKNEINAFTGRDKFISI